ncbi:hypothetical protein HG535_0D04050 [Zygotorulaspora mrakii]|uniref:TEL2-interacting protein 1 n=1 Tax=Zygotorulaspora mrakii TaxID=42260 RepID=A0A7H9B2I6_ZYGMR|nr:uncharacterized protein HG535_0D04050 [Zygotorulaspora mrakii]QLG72697.1 hypothetical protein HG535_0D04050 [Zygotorulaspora mrakii]
MTDESLIFQELRPLCVELSRIAFQPQKVFNPNSTALLNALSRLDTKLALYQNEVFSQSLADYLFVPIASLLKQERLGDQHTELVLLILSHMLRLSWREIGTFPKELSQQLLTLINFLIAPNAKIMTLNKRSTSYRSSSAAVLLEYFRSLKNQVYVHEFFSSVNSYNLSGLGHGITILLEILESSIPDPQVQLSALETLFLLYQGILKDGEILSFVLPGNVSTFSKLLSKPGLTVNYKVVIRTLEIFGTLLALVYDDFSLMVHDNRPTNIQGIVNKQVHNQDQDSAKSNMITIDKATDFKRHRDSSWLRATSGQIKIALKSFVHKMTKRNNRNIMTALADFLSHLLMRCSISLSNCEHLVLSALIELRMDPKYQLPKHHKCLVDIIREKISRINHIIQFEDVNGFKSLLFAIKVLNQCSFKYEDLMIPDLSMQVTEIIEQSSAMNGHHKILEQSSNVFMSEAFDKSLVKSANTPSPIFSCFSNEIEEYLGDLLIVLGSISADRNRLSELIETILTEDATVSLYRKTASLWLSTWLLKGMKEDAETSAQELLVFKEVQERDVTGCYSILEYCDSLAQEVVLASEGKALNRETETALRTILFSIEAVSGILKKDFECELIDHIYTVIENLASSSPTIRQSAQSSALSIAQNIYGGSVREMVLDNIDYLTESVSVRLNSGLTERVSTVLGVICKIAGYQIIESFKDIFESIFKLIDHYHGYDEMCLQFFQLFEVIVLEMKKRYYSQNDAQFKVTSDSTMRGSYEPWGMTSLQDLMSLLDEENIGKAEPENTALFDDDNTPKNFEELFNSKVREIDSDDEDQEEEDDANGNAQQSFGGNEKIEWISPIPLASYRILLQIFNYGDRLLTHRSRQLRIQILITLKLIVPMLATQYDSLLPQIAQSWDVMVACSIDHDLAVVKYSCDCLQEMTRCSQDFITKRFLDLWGRWQEKSALLKELHPGRWSSIQNNSNKSLTLYKTKFPPVAYKALLSMCNVLLEGISVAGLMLTDSTLKEMIYGCLQVLPAKTVSNQSFVAADVVYAITHDLV